MGADAPPTQQLCAATLLCRNPLAHTDVRMTPARVWIETSGMAVDRDAWTSRRAEESGMLLRVKYERLWERLIESLNNWTSASETGAG